MTYIIGEIGQNHNGSVDIAKLIIDLASEHIKENLFGYNLKGIDAIKLTEMSKPYKSINSFGKTYGDHRKKLELSYDEHLEIYNYTKSKNMDFVETLCSIGCLSILQYKR